MEVRVAINRIFLIGNGFDLAHGLNTSYKSFMLWLLSSMIKVSSFRNNYEDEHVSILYTRTKRLPPDLEGYLEGLFTSGKLADLTHVKGEGLVYDRSDYFDNPFYIEVSCVFLKDLIDTFLDKSWSGIENAIYLSLKRFHYQVQGKFPNQYSIERANIKGSENYLYIKDAVESTNDAISYLIAKLEEYLSLQVLEDSNISSFFNEIIVKRKSVNKISNLFLDFNYTSTIDKYVLDLQSQPGEKIYLKHISIHGKIHDEDQKVIFGFGDEQESFYKEIESDYDNCWLANQKSFAYLQSSNYQDLLSFITSGYYSIHVIGHSCSITDRTLLNLLFENEHCSEILIYNHDGMKSYLDKAYNIARNFENKSMFRQLVKPYNPQLNFDSIGKSKK